MEGTYRDMIIALEKELEEAKCLKNEADAKCVALRSGEHTVKGIK